MADCTELGVLNRLIETCRDGERGFRFAAQHAQEQEVKNLFTELALEWADFADALTPHVRRLGGQARTDGSTLGTVHRGWMNLMSNASRHHDSVLIAEAERGERAALFTYEEAMKGLLAPAVLRVVERQHAGIRETYARVSALDRN